MHDSRTEAISRFTEWARQHITGDEKGQAQVFLDRLFQAFGQRGVHEAGASFEYRVKNTKGGTAFADLVWKPKVLIEMKKRGSNLADHLQQAFDYWTRLVPGRPRYVVICNFDEFRIYDFDVDLSEPQDTVKLTELPDRYLALAFLFPTDEPPQFKIDRVKVTRAAADKLAAVYNRLEAKPNVGPETAQRFVLQILVALFSEDIGFVPKGFVSQLLSECTDPPKAFDLLNGLFNAMNTPGGAKGGRFKDVPYFNGGLFAHPAPVELDPQYEGFFLREAAEHDWSHISPDIFGTLFQHSMGKEQRHAFGAHYTSPTDIMKIVKPTIVDPFRAAIDSATTLKELVTLRHRLSALRVLDPACGSGNFLYIAYREMRRLEAAINTKENELSKRQHAAQMSMSRVSPTQFFGLDILPFAVELAKVTLAIAPKLASDELHTSEPTLPLANLDNNIQRRDALIDDLGNPAQWPPADVIIGNPPFLDARKLTVERGRSYTKTLERLYPDVPRRADLCTYWIRRAHDHLPMAGSSNPHIGRAGLVGTQNIRNNEAREGGLDHVVATAGTILEAVENQPWSGEANVHVSIVNWLKSDDPTLIPKQRMLWSKVEERSIKKRSKEGPASKQYELQGRTVDSINSALSDEHDVSGASVLKCNTNPKVVFEGVQTGHNGFVITASEARRLLENPKHASYIKPFINGADLLSSNYIAKPEYVIDLSTLDMLEAAALPELLAIPKERVLEDWQRNAEKENADTGKSRGEHQNRLDDWWALKRPRLDLQAAISRLPRYVACSAVMKRATFVFLSNRFLPTNALKVFAFADDYSFGILQSSVHWTWFVTKCSKLKADFRYTPETVFDTFPWPQSPTKKQIDAVASAAVELRRVRADALSKLKGGLRALYRTLELPGQSPLKDAHAALDSAVLSAYGFSPKQDLLSQLLELNQVVASQEKSGKPVTAPGVPPTYPNPSTLVTTDCIRP